MSPYPIDTPLDFNRDTRTDAIAGAPDSDPCPNGLDGPSRFNIESLLGEIGFPAHVVQELLTSWSASDFSE